MMYQILKVDVDVGILRRGQRKTSFPLAADEPFIDSWPVISVGDHAGWTQADRKIHDISRSE